MPAPNKEFAARFQQACRDAGLDTRNVQLGKALGVSGVMARNYWLGEKLPSMQKAIEIADKTNVCVEWLLTGRGPKSPATGDAAKEWLDLSALDPDAKAALRALLHSLRQSRRPKANHDD